jgi:transcriptional regulator with XRE-family HTH domain
MSRENLKQARINAGLTQNQISEKLNIGLRYYQMIEAGQRNGDFAIWDKLEDIFKIHQRKLREIEEIHHDKVSNQ